MEERSRCMNSDNPSIKEKKMETKYECLDCGYPHVFFEDGVTNFVCSQCGKIQEKDKCKVSKFYKIVGMEMDGKLGTQKLYRVTLRGFSGYGSGVVKDVSYVVARDPGDAYNKVKKHLDDKDYGYVQDRELRSVELIAEDKDYAACQSRLFL